MNLSPLQIMLIRECARDDLAFGKLLDLYLNIARQIPAGSKELAEGEISPGKDHLLKIKAQSHDRPVPAAGAKLIGVIDDSSSLLDIVQRILEHEGFRVSTFQNPVDLLESDYTPPDLILLDIEMPEMNGAVAMDRFKADPRFARSKIVFMTGLVSQEEAVQLSLPGKTAYLSKPFTREKLVEIVKHGLNGAPKVDAKA